MQEKRLALILVKKSDNPDASSMAERTNVSKGYATKVEQHTISTKFAPL